ncbi:MAG TPA: DUF3426 domain-containing protein [Ramlibacter sp.]|uniref:DUF3426 domain-containing protein n=1 Tax=Ramlibacter sp. TaxID=1917967 RepID=UPI002ED05910
MSMITSCPACGTMFRVVPDQLKISEGWVRCGHCAEVFDATAHLSDESILEMPPLAEPIRQAKPPAAPPAEAPRPPPEPPPAKDHPSDNSSLFGAESQMLEPSPLDTPFVFRPSDLVRESRDSTMPEDLPSDMSMDIDSEMPPGEEREITPEDLPNVSFVRKARRRSIARRPGVRIGLAVLSVLLAALLVLQLAWQDRDRLALAQPALRPWLEHMCNALECRLGPPRQIESIVIESSGFNRLRNDVYRLSFTLRNTAPVQVAAPAIELTVTDGNDQAIARRVITPQEIGASADTIASGSDWSGSLGLAVSPSNARVAGYRLLAFYP